MRERRRHKVFQSYEVSYYLYFVILGLALYYLYKAFKQIKSKDIDFFKKEIYTPESVQKWAMVDGLLKVATAVTFAVYGALGLIEINIIDIAIAVLVVIIVLYFVLYSKILKKKEEY